MTPIFSRLNVLALIVACGLLVPAAAQADTTGPITVAAVGVQGNQMYIVSPDLPTACAGTLYLSLANSSYNASYVMSLALSARLTNARINRVDYTQGSPCTIDLIQL